ESKIDHIIANARGGTALKAATDEQKKPVRRTGRAWAEAPETHYLFGTRYPCAWNALGVQPHITNWGVSDIFRPVVMCSVFAAHWSAAATDTERKYAEPVELVTEAMHVFPGVPLPSQSRSVMIRTCPG